MMTTGQLVTTDDTFNLTSAGYPVTVDNVVRELLAARQELESVRRKPAFGGLHRRRRGSLSFAAQPFLVFSDVVGNAQQSANIVPFTQFATDLNGGAPGTLGNLPNYTFIVPDAYDDRKAAILTETSCTTERIADADAWIQSNIGPLLQMPAFQQSGLLIITWDEGETSDTSNGLGGIGGGHVATILVGAGVKAAYQQQTTNVYDHASLLRLTMDSLGLTTQLPISNVTPMTEFFQEKLGALHLGARVVKTRQKPLLLLSAKPSP